MSSADSSLTPAAGFGFGDDGSSPATPVVAPGTGGAFGFVASSGEPAAQASEGFGFGASAAPFAAPPTAANNWNQPAPQQPAANGWGAPAAEPPSAANNWGQPQQQQQQPAANGFGFAAALAESNGWGQPQQQQQQLQQQWGQPQQQQPPQQAPCDCGTVPHAAWCAINSAPSPAAQQQQLQWGQQSGGWGGQNQQVAAAMQSVSNFAGRAGATYSANVDPEIQRAVQERADQAKVAAMQAKEKASAKLNKLKGFGSRKFKQARGPSNQGSGLED